MEGLRPLCAAGGNVKVAAHMEKNMAVLQNIKNRINVWSSHFTYGYRPQRIESNISKRYLYTHVRSSILHSSQHVEATHVSVDRWMDQQNVVCAYNGILFFHKRGNSHTMKIWMNLEDIMLSKISLSQKDTVLGNSLAVHWLGTGTLTGWGTTVPQATWHGQKKKKRYLWFHLYEVCREVILIETKSRMVVARG